MPRLQEARERTQVHTSVRDVLRLQTSKTNGHRYDAEYLIYLIDFSSLA